MAAAKATRQTPASTFTELLRRSRFASFDPAIAQTYTAPPAYARRGNYGLKRPVPMPYKDSYISLSAFEHHAHFTEWNNAGQQVKFVKCVEEMNVFPRHVPSASASTWERGLGEAKTQWLIDSEFCEHTYSEAGRPEQSPGPEVPETNLDSYGKQGPGGYGSRRPPANGVSRGGHHAQPNIAAMSPKQFQRYLTKLRQLRPQFQAYVAEQQRQHLWSQRHREIQAQLAAEAKAAGETDHNPSVGDVRDMPEAQEDDFSLFIASQNAHHKLHRRFLSEHVAKDYSPPDSTRIEKQPHQNGGLLYSHPSILESTLSTLPQPGLVLQNVPRFGAYFNDKPQHDYVALTGGITALLRHSNAGAKLPLYSPEREHPLTPKTATTSGDSLENSSASLRMIALKVRSPPNVVSRAAARMNSKEMMRNVAMLGECITDLPWSQRNLTNPYRPGSYEYITSTPNKQSRYLLPQRNITGSASPALSHFGKMQKKNAENIARKALRPRGVIAGESSGGGPSTDRVLKSLTNIVASGRGVQRVRDEDL